MAHTLCTVELSQSISQSTTGRISIVKNQPQLKKEAWSNLEIMAVAYLFKLFGGPLALYAFA